MSVHLTLTTFQKQIFFTLIKNAKISFIATETGAEITRENFEIISDVIENALFRLNTIASTAPDSLVEVTAIQQIAEKLDKLEMFFPKENKEVITGEVGKEVTDWVDPGDAPKLSKEWFEKAELRPYGEAEVIKPRRKKKL